MTSSGTDEPFIDQLDAGTGGYNEPTPEVNDRTDEVSDSGVADPAESTLSPNDCSDAGLQKHVVISAMILTGAMMLEAHAAR